MTAIKNIFCPIDFSDCSRHAVEYAVALARHFDATVTALHVVTPVAALLPVDVPIYPPLGFTPEDLEQFRRQAAAFVRDESGGTRVYTEVLEGNVTEEIVRRAETLPADLVVIGTHGRSGLDRFMLGSVTERILRKVSAPVLTVPPRAVDAVPIGPIPFAQIVCAVDFSPASMRALHYAATLARGTNAVVTAVHVVEPVPAFELVTMGGREGGELDELARAAARKRLNGAIAQGVRAANRWGEIVATGDPAREILRIARELHSDLIVIGVSGGHFTTVGSTANHIVREASCPVLSLRE